MSKTDKYVRKVIQEIEKVRSIESSSLQLSPRDSGELQQNNIPGYFNEATKEGQRSRLAFLKENGHTIDYISGEKSFDGPEKLKGNIENFIGMAQIPIGLAGPLLVNGLHTSGEFFVPMATTEGTLVASYNRGMKACRMSGGITSVCLIEGVQRTPYFKFDRISTVGKFVMWVHEQLDTFHEIVERTSNHAELREVKTNMEGNSVILTFEYSTGDASGQNMVTICTDRICKYIIENFPVEPKEWYIESNHSGDKKATALSFINVRGKKVTSEVVVPKEVVNNILKTTPEKVVKYWQSSTLAVMQSGAIGAQGHVANGLTAMFIACGQDVACISESSVGVTRMELTENGDLYASLTLPTLMVGTVGGGTGLPTQQECLQLLGCVGKGNARKFAEICCAVALAGEISIASAMSVDHFTNAHENLGRKPGG